MTSGFFESSKKLFTSKSVLDLDQTRDITDSLPYTFITIELLNIHSF
jgi:hypothetical protein